MSGKGNRVAYLPSTALFIVGGILAAAAVGVGTAWGVEDTKDKKNTTPTPSPIFGRVDEGAAPADRAVGDDFDITTQVGLQPSQGQDTEGKVWDQAQQGTTSSATFTYNYDVPPPRTSLELTNAGVNVVNVTCNVSKFLPYVSSNLSINNNGYIFDRLPLQTDIVNSLLLPFKGSSLLFGHVDSTVGQGFAFGYTNGTFVKTELDDTDWMSPEDVDGVPKITDAKNFYHMLAVTMSGSGDRVVLYYDILTKDEDSASAPYKKIHCKYYVNGTFPADQAQILFRTLDPQVLFGGSIVAFDKNFYTDDDAALQYANAWQTAYANYQQPLILDEVSTQVFYVGFNADDRGYVKPSVNNPLPTDANKFKLNGSLPDGMSLVPADGVFTGTPQAPFQSTPHLVYYNTVSKLESNPEPISITVEPAPLIDYGGQDGEPPTFTFFQGAESEVPAPVIVSLSTDVTDTVAVTAGTLPAGMTLNASTGAITGTPTTIGEANDLQVSATAAAIPRGTTCAPSALRIHVVATPPDPVTIEITYPQAISLDYQQNIQTINPVIKLDGDVVTKVPDGVFSVTPALPAGVVLNPATGTITGTPTEIASPDTYTIECKAPGGVGYDTMQLDVEGQILIPANVTVQNRATLDYQVRFSPDVLNGYELLASDIQPALPNGLYVEGTRIKGTVDTTSITKQQYKMRAGFKVPDVTEGVDYTLAHGEFTLTVEPFNPPVPPDNLSTTDTNLYLGLTVGLAAGALVLLVVAGLLLKHERRSS